jgi:hypothetical protein
MLGVYADFAGEDVHVVSWRIAFDCEQICGDHWTFRCKPRGAETAQVPRKDEQVLPRTDTPYAERTVSTGSGDKAAIRAESGLLDHIGVAPELSQADALLDVPDSRGVVVAGAQSESRADGIGRRHDR